MNRLAESGTETLQTLPELLAPAGSEDSLRAALAAGADAVYFGGTAFSNRMRAKNFTNDALRDAIRLCHSVGAKAHITLNTRVRDREYDDALALADTILGGDSDCRCDAVICADFGLARELLRRYPHAVLHASTQTSLSSPADCRALGQMGFARLVVPRELSGDEIAALVQSSPIEIEMFLHGAHCVSLSGQCLLSFMMGGRSGNRGECAQPCRLPYTKSGASASSYPLSLADMCLAGDIPAVIATGVSSLKLEGRLKSAAYVYGVTRIYRTLLDERRAATSAEQRALADLFTRGFTDGYFTRSYAGMSAKPSAEKTGSDVAQTVSKALAARQADYRAVCRSACLAASERPITARFVLRAGEPVRLTLFCGGVSVTASGEIPQAATGSPLDLPSAAKQLTKCGGTGFSLAADAIDAELDDGLWMPVSQLNDLRRRALGSLKAALADADTANETNSTSSDAGSEQQPKPVTTLPPALDDSGWTAEFGEGSKIFRTPPSDALLTALGERCSVLALPAVDLAGWVKNPFAEEALRLHDTGRLGSTLEAVLPPFTPDGNAIASLVEFCRDHAVRRIVCHTPGQVTAVRDVGLQAGISAILSFRGNIVSARAAKVYRDLGCAAVTLSPELNAASASAVAKDVRKTSGMPCQVIGYGRLPLMHLSRCVLCGGQCRKGRLGGRIPFESAKNYPVRPASALCRGSVTDRKAETFPLYGCHDCTVELLNAVPIWMGDRLTSLPAAVRFLFRPESAEEVLAVLGGYENGQSGSGRRL